MTDEKAARLAALRAANSTRRQTDTPQAKPVIQRLDAGKVPEQAVHAGTDPELFTELPPAMAPQAVLGMLFAAIIGALSAIIVLPGWLPGLSASLVGAEPQASWYLSRSSAFVAYILLWLAMISGLLITNKLARAWPGGPTAFDLHQHTSLLGLAFAMFHGLILLGDRYVQATLEQILVPFHYTGYEAAWVGLGQIAFYGMAMVGLSYYVKERIGRRLWRLVHFLSFVVFALALAHGVWSGSDSQTDMARVLYWSSGTSVLFLTIYRILVSIVKRTGSTRSTAPMRHS